MTCGQVQLENGAHRLDREATVYKCKWRKIVSESLTVLLRSDNGLLNRRSTLLLFLLTCRRVYMGFVMVGAAAVRGWL